MRLPGFDTPKEQWLLMQNYDMTHQELFELIFGSVKYHGDALPDYEPSAIIVNYNPSDQKEDILVAVGTEIYKKSTGQNSFSSLFDGFKPGGIKQSVNIRGKSYIAAGENGLYEFDGISKISKIGDIKPDDIIIAKETNRAFAITTSNEIVWTDDLATIGGVPIVWNPLNVDILPPTLGDVPEKLWMLNGRLVILMTNSIWVYYVNGSPTNWRPEQAPTSVGCIAPKTVRQVGREIWFLGYSPSTGRGVYAFNGSESRFLSYDVEPFINRANHERIQEACAEYVDNIYKLSLSVDSSLTNNYTLHFDTINTNPDTGMPNIYGPHTYGFNCSAVLNTRKFKGEHLFGRKASDGGRIYRVADYGTQYSDELVDNGELIQGVLVSGIIDKEEYKGEAYDATWMKRYENIFVEYPPKGNWGSRVEILRGCENETVSSFHQYLEGPLEPLFGFILDEMPIDNSELSVSQNIQAFTSDSIQLRVTNSNVGKKSSFRSLKYDARPIRRKKAVERVYI